MSYEGLIPRQALVDFCQKQVEQIQKDRDNLDSAMKTPGLNEDRKHSFEQVDWMRMGEQTALRNVCEWAKDNLVDVTDVEVKI